MIFSSRQSVIVWLHSLKQIKQLRRYGNIHYVSKKLKYVVIYMDMDRIEDTMDRMNSMSFVKKVEPSYRPYLKTEFENSRPDKAKEYDYKIGI